MEAIIDLMDHEHLSENTKPYETEGLTSGTNTHTATTATGRGLRTRPWRKRASRACRNCRARKVRCDVIVQEGPCSNCKHDEIECSVPLPRRRKRRTTRVIQEDVFRLQPMYVPQVHADAGVELDFFQDFSSGRDVTANNDAASSLEQTEIAENSVLDFVGSWDDFTGDGFPVANDGDDPVSERSTASLYSTSSGRERNPLPSIFRPLPTTLELDDIEYLQKVDALSIPEKFLQLELFRSYVEYFHCHYPILDIQGFVDGLSEKEDTKLSLLVFQGVMFCGASFAKMSILKEAGFATREEAQVLLFRRVKCLYDFDCETDSIAIIQALLLMTSARHRLSEGKAWWHWLGLAISLSFRMGLHRNTFLSTIGKKEKALCRRIWWTCVICDRLVALREGKPLAIKIGDCDVPMLNMDDFDLRDLEDSDERMRQQEIAIKCIDKALLCWTNSNYLLDGTSPPKSQHPSLGTGIYSTQKDVNHATPPLQDYARAATATPTSGDDSDDSGTLPDRPNAVMMGRKFPDNEMIFAGPEGGYEDYDFMGKRNTWPHTGLLETPGFMHH